MDDLRGKLEAALDRARLHQKWPDDMSEAALEAIMPLVEAALLRERSDTAEKIAQAIEASPAGRYVRVQAICSVYEDEDGTVDGGCGTWPCPGHPDGHYVMHDKEHFAALARSGGGGTPEQARQNRPPVWAPPEVAGRLGKKAVERSNPAPEQGEADR